MAVEPYAGEAASGRGRGPRTHTYPRMHAHALTSSAHVADKVKVKVHRAAASRPRRAQLLHVGVRRRRPGGVRVDAQVVARAPRELADGLQRQIGGVEAVDNVPVQVLGDAILTGVEER